MSIYGGIPHYANEKYFDAIYDCSDNATLLLWKDANEEMLLSYIAKLEELSFTKHQELDDPCIHSVTYYKEQLGGSEEDYAIYVPSPFDVNKRLLMVGRDVSTKYTRRTRSEYEKIALYLDYFVSARLGNYFVFFPSYQMMEQTAELAEELLGWRQGDMKDDGSFTFDEAAPVHLYVQKAGMTEKEKELFLEAFAEQPGKRTVGFCVMGGIFGEGIDLKNDRLIGTVVVGTGLPMVCDERELFTFYFDEKNGRGFDYAYLYPGMNKVMQSAGRVIRTTEDTGAILLLDERFLSSSYQNLFPREWFPYESVTATAMKSLLQSFWHNTIE